MASVGKPWSDAGPVVWFWTAWPLESEREPFILVCILFSCVRHACTIWIFESTLFLSVFVLLVVRLMETEVKYRQSAIFALKQI